MLATRILWSVKDCRKRMNARGSLNRKGRSMEVERPADEPILEDTGQPTLDVITSPTSVQFEIKHRAGSCPVNFAHRTSVQMHTCPLEA